MHTLTHVFPLFPHPTQSHMHIKPSVKAGGKRVVTKHKHEEPDSDAYDQKYVDSLPEPP